MTLYDELIEGAIDVHCHIDLEFSAKQRKRESELQWLPKAAALGMRGLVLKSHWWPTVNVVPYILASVDTKVTLWSSVALNLTAGGPNPCVIESCAELGGKMIFLPTWSARNDIERKGFSHRLKSIYKNCGAMENPAYYFLDDRGRLVPRGRELVECCKAYNLTLGMGHVSWQESLAFVEAGRDLGFHRMVINHAQSQIIGAPTDALKRAADLGAFVEVCWNILAPGRMDSPEVVQQLRAIGLRQVVASTDYFRPYSPNPAELMRMFLGMLHEGGLTKEEVKLVGCTNPARLMGLDYVR
ncbi:MAG TPA: DUF6282 family protein [Candidatus Binatia bacterium]|nr:DUF6282 family protein [Candidatus Binatia bacterium]